MRVSYFPAPVAPVAVGLKFKHLCMSSFITWLPCLSVERYVRARALEQADLTSGPSTVSWGAPVNLQVDLREV